MIGSVYIYRRTSPLGDTSVFVMITKYMYSADI